MNIPLNIFSTTLTVLTGLVIYAFYASCDPLSTGEINTDDEVHYVIREISILFVFVISVQDQNFNIQFMRIKGMFN